jgi:hypothetical protein
MIRQFEAGVARTKSCSVYNGPPTATGHIRDSVNICAGQKGRSGKRRRNKVGTKYVYGASAVCVHGQRYCGLGGSQDALLGLLE